MNKFIVDINAQTGARTETPISDSEWNLLIANAPVEDVYPNWDALYGRFLAGDLKPIFDDVCEKAENSTAIALRYFNLVESFKIRTEQALKDCLDKLIQAGYVVGEDHKNLWNNATTELNFSELVRLS